MNYPDEATGGSGLAFLNVEVKPRSSSRFTPPKKSHASRLVLILVAIAVGGGGGVGYFAWKQALAAKYGAVRTGMTVKEVEAILGKGRENDSSIAVAMRSSLRAERMAMSHLRSLGHVSKERIVCLDTDEFLYDLGGNTIHVWYLKTKALYKAKSPSKPMLFYEDAKTGEIVAQSFKEK